MAFMITLGNLNQLIGNDYESIYSKTPAQGNQNMKDFLEANGFDMSDWETVEYVNNQFFETTTQGKTYEVLQDTILPIPDENNDPIFMEGVRFVNDEGQVDSTPLLLIHAA